MNTADPRPMLGSLPGLEPDVQVAIARNLRAVYDDVLNQPIPERFARLLRDLERKESTK